MNIRIDPVDDLKTARAAIMNAITGHEKVLADPEPALLLMELTDYSVNFSARAWLRTSDFWTVRSERSEEHTSELQSRGHLVCRLLLEKKNGAMTASCTTDGD